MHYITHICVSVLSHFSCVQLFATLWSITCQVSLTMGFSRQEYWSGLSGPPPGDLPNSGIEPRSLTALALAGGFFTISTTWKAHITCTCVYKCIKNIFMLVPVGHLYIHAFNWINFCSFPLPFYMHTEVCQGWFVTLAYPSLPHLFQLPCSNVRVHTVSILTSVPLLLGIHCHLLPDVENLSPYFLPDLSSPVHNC